MGFSYEMARHWGKYIPSRWSGLTREDMVLEKRYPGYISRMERNRAERNSRDRKYSSRREVSSQICELPVQTVIVPRD